MLLKPCQWIEPIMDQSSLPRSSSQVALTSVLFFILQGQSTVDVGPLSVCLVIFLVNNVLVLESQSSESRLNVFLHQSIDFSFIINRGKGPN